MAETWGESNSLARHSQRSVSAAASRRFVCMTRMLASRKRCGNQGDEKRGTKWKYKRHFELLESRRDDEGVMAQVPDSSDSTFYRKSKTLSTVF